MVNDTTRLLGLEGLAVVEVIARDEHAGKGPIVWLATTDERVRMCPGCG
jgi:hypothetical protein